MTECRDWSAWYNRMPGADDPNLHVAGTCSKESSSIRLWLEPGNEGIVDEPDLFVLELKAERPDFGDTQYVEESVSWEGNVGEDIKRVRVQGEASTEVPVTEAQ